MAVGAANQFYIQPATADISPILKGIGEVSKRKREEDKAAKATAEVTEAVKSGDPSRMADIAIKYPQYANAAKQAFGFTNKATEDFSKNAYRRALSDPDNAAQYIQEGIAQVTSAGGTPAMMTNDLNMLGSNPDAALKAMKMGYASVDPAGYKSLYGDAKDRFKQQEINIKERTLEIRKDENESRKDEQSLKNETNELKRQELQQKIDERKLNIEAKKREFEIDAKAKVQKTGSMLDVINDFTTNKKYMAAVTGYRGRLPAITTTGLEAEAYFNQIKNNLTLDNLSLMTGVLTDRDIAVLASAASALKAGMSRAGMLKEMTKIKGVLEEKSKDVQGMILGTVEIPEQQAAPAQEDNQALEWARANPNDPRAAQIMQLQGAQ